MIKLNKKRIIYWLIIIYLAAMLGFITGHSLAGYLLNKNSCELQQEDVEITIAAEEELQPNKYLGKFTLTAYCPCEKCCGKWADGLTYCETVATENRTIAVDPDIIPLGSKVEINGNEYIAEDIGGAIKGNRIDVFFDTHEKALNFGVQYEDVYLKSEE